MSLIEVEYRLQTEESEILPELINEMVLHINPAALKARLLGHREDFDSAVEGSFKLDQLLENVFQLSLYIPWNELYNKMGIAAALPMIFGNTIRSSKIRSIRLLRLKMPEEFHLRYRGPKYGLKGLMELLKKRPPFLAVTMVSVRDANGTVDEDQVKELIEGGIDVLVDNQFEVYFGVAGLNQRLRDLFKVIGGKRILYIAHATGDQDKALALAESIEQAASEWDVPWGLRICPFSAGFSTIDVLRRLASGGVIYAYNMLSRIYDANPGQGISGVVGASVLRAMGADCYSIGSPFDEIADSVVAMHAAKQELLSQVGDKAKIEKSVPILTGGILPWRVGKLMQDFGSNIVLHVGRGITFNPLGKIRMAIEAYKEAIRAFQEGKSLESIVKTSGRSKLSKYLRDAPIDEILKYDVLGKKVR